MSYVSEVEGFLGTTLSPTWRKVAEVLERWDCSSFHAAAIIHWMIRGRKSHEETLLKLRRLAETNAAISSGITFQLQMLKHQISRASKSEHWPAILAAAQQTGMSLKEISALFEGFLDGVISPQAISNPAAALATIQQNHPKYRI